MKEIAIEDLAYLIKQAKKNGQPQPIFFLGAGASKTGNIPLAGEIEKKILTDFHDNPFIKKLADKDKVYAKLLDCLSPHDRNELLKQYINEAKINVTHIYLAQLLRNNFIDYVLTVNFDNLMLRALALYNEFPPTYDMAILKDLTTTSFKEKSIVYLHGQHHGLWLLNTPEEMDKVKATVPRIFDSIKNKRPWVFIGYSGSDPIFEHVLNLGRFDNGLYWVTYKNHLPGENVQTFIRKANTNAAIIKGYDSDSFMLKLNEELGLPQPKILDKPFSSLHEMLNEIVDVNEEDHFKGVKERLEIAKGSVEKAIVQFEEGKIKKTEDFEKDLEINALKKEIIDVSISEEYDEELIAKLVDKAKSLNDDSVDELLAGLYYNWGNEFGKQAKQSTNEEADELFYQAFDKYEKSLALKLDQPDVWYNWGTYLGNLADFKTGEAAEKLCYESIHKYEKSLRLNPDDHSSFTNWGTCLVRLAELKTGEAAEMLYQQAIEKFEQAFILNPDDYNSIVNLGAVLTRIGNLKTGEEAEILYRNSIESFDKSLRLKPDNHNAFLNWGLALMDIANLKIGKESELLYDEAIEKFRQVVKLKPEDHDALTNWGAVLGLLARLKTGEESEELYRKAFKKYAQSFLLKSDNYRLLQSWGSDLGELGKLKEGEEAQMLFQQAIDKLHQAVDLGSNPYNLACFLALTGEKRKALSNLEQSLINNFITTDFVLQDPDWKNLLDDKDFKALIKKYSTASS